MEAHPPLDPAVDRGGLVLGKIVARLRAQQDDDLLERACSFSASSTRGADGTRLR